MTTTRPRPRARRGRRLATILVVGLALASGEGSSVALATDQETVASTVTTDTLDPAAGLLCNGATSCTVALVNKPVLTWTATPDPYATGYDILRSTTSGSGYTVIASVTGRTTTTHTDTTVAPVTSFFFVVRAVAGSWFSHICNQVQATVLL
jgi:hypothetical protein